MAVTPRGKTSSTPQITETELRHHQQELGWFGTVFGSRQQAAVIFAGVIGVICAVGLIGVGILAPSGADKGELQQNLVTIVIAAFTFLGGIVGSGGPK